MPRQASTIARADAARLACANEWDHKNAGMHPPESHDGAMLAMVVGVVALATPLRVLWLRDGSAWWLPFAVWLGIVGLAAWSARREDR